VKNKIVKIISNQYYFKKLGKIPKWSRMGGPEELCF